MAFYDKTSIIGGLSIWQEKKTVHRVQMTDGKRNIIRQLLEEYDIESDQDIKDALKDLLGGTIKEMKEVERMITWGIINQSVQTMRIIEMVLKRNR
jgi:hypothetical protein